MKKERAFSLRPQERLINLGVGGLRLIQRQDFFCPGEDSAWLAEFAEIAPHDRVLDMGCGNGAALFLIHAKAPAATLHGVEIMPACAELARRNVYLNNLDEPDKPDKAEAKSHGGIKIFCADIRSFAPPETKTLYDKIVCNPPYAAAGSGRQSPVAEKAAAIFQLHGGLRDFFAAARRLLKPDGKAFFVLPFANAEQAVSAAAACGLRLTKSQIRQGKRHSDKALSLLEFSPIIKK